MKTQTTRTFKKRALSLLATFAMATGTLTVLPSISAAAAAEKYPLKIAGIQVTSENCDDILGDGVFSYLPQSKLLTVCGNATSNGSVIDSESALTIDVQGDSLLTSLHSDTISGGNGTLMITGAGELNLKAPEGCGINMGYDSILRICELKRMDIGDAQYGIRGPAKNPSYDGTNLKFDHANIWINVHDAAVERIAGDIALSYCCFEGYAPVIFGQNADGQYLIAADNQQISTYVHICSDEDQYEKYELNIGGIPVSVVNRDDVLGNGVFKYDPDNNVLEINGDHKTFNYVDGAMITNGIGNLTVLTVEDSVLKAVTSRVLQTEEDMVITGSSKLTMTAEYKTMDCLSVNGGTLTISDANLVLSGERAIACCNQNSELVIDRSAVRAFGRISDFHSIILSKCGITLPANGEISMRNSAYSIFEGDDFASEVTISVNVPKIGLHPQDVTAVVGENAQFFVAASGSSLTYKWQYNSGSGWKDTQLEGKNTATLKVPVIATRNGLKYRCIVSCDSGKSVISNSATLTVVTPTKITKQPASASGCIDDTVKFTVSAEGTNLKYKWQYNSGSGWKDTQLEGKNTATLKVPVIATRNGLKYRCIVTGADGQSKTSSAATLTVNVKITMQPANVSGKIDDTARFSITATGAGTLSYQWQFNKGDGWKDSTAAGAKTANLSVSVTAARDGQQYRCVVKSSNGTTVTSNAATIKVKPTITTQPKNYSGKVNSTAKFTVAASGAGEQTYQWQFNNGTGWQNSSNATAKNATLSVTATAARNGYQYRCIVKFGNGTSVTSNAATLTVK